MRLPLLLVGLRGVRAAHGLAALLARERLLALALHRGLLVEGAALHFLEGAVLQHLLLECLQRRLDLVADDVDAAGRAGAAAFARIPPFQHQRSRREVHWVRGGSDLSTIFIAVRRLVPSASAAAMVPKP